jgi:hypothetical protein
MESTREELGKVWNSQGKANTQKAHQRVSLTDRDYLSSLQRLVN